MGHYGITPNLIRLIHELYEAPSCQVIHNGKSSEPFEMKFKMVVDWIMSEVESQGKTGIK